MSTSNSLKSYRQKRRGGKSPEPGKSGETGKRARRSRSSSRPRFVIQMHDASSLHFDLRLESDGVLKSWAIPKGPSTDPREKRLALPTEDHPLEYAEFEGVIPEGEYGAGTVSIWDRGTFRNTTENDGERVPFHEALEAGHATFVLQGRKLRGGYALTRTSSGKRPKWLLVKMDDSHADARRNPVSTERKSVQSGRTLHQIRRDAKQGGAS